MMIVQDECGETVRASVVLKQRDQGTRYVRPSILVMVKKPESGTVHTGTGAGSFDIYMTAETQLKIKEVTGHGKIIIKPQSILEHMLEFHTSPVETTIIPMSLLNAE